MVIGVVARVFLSIFYPKMIKIRKLDTGNFLILKSFTFFVKNMIKFVGKNIGSD